MDLLLGTNVAYIHAMSNAGTNNEVEPNIDILYEDADCVVINKPSGLMVHPDGRSKGPFLTDWVVAHFPETAGVGEPARSDDGSPIDRSGIVHRLDRETSGSLIIVKTQKGFLKIKSQFHDRLITKKYLAFVWGELKEEFGTITRPIGRSNSDFRKWSAQRGARGEMRDAETYWSRIWTGKSEILDEESKTVLEKFSLLEAEPKTGRTHQIRVHLQAIQHPVVGDALYSPKRPKALGFERTALHSRSIEFVSPATGKKVKVEAPLPIDFEKAVETLNISL